MKIQIINKHILLSLNSGYYLIDTGSAVSFGKDSEINIEGKNYKISSSIMGVDIIV